MSDFSIIACRKSSLQCYHNSLTGPDKPEGWTYESQTTGCHPSKDYSCSFSQADATSGFRLTGDLLQRYAVAMTLQLNDYLSNLTTSCLEHCITFTERGTDDATRMYAVNGENFH